ncbi:hypothetical protein Tco_0273737 [Tanacetum coccineum]
MCSFASSLSKPLIIMESLVKKKQKGAILELKRRHLKNTIFCTYTPYPIKKIWRISASSEQETRNDQFPILLNLIHVIMDDPNITMEDYIRLEEEKALRRGTVYNWETAKYGKIWYDEDIHDLKYVETKFPAIVFNDALMSEVTPLCGPSVSPLNDNEIDFRLSFDKFDDEDYTVVYDENSFSYKIISVNNLKTDSENDKDKVNMPSFPSPKPAVSYFNYLDFFKDFENEYPAIVYNDALTSKSDFLTEHIEPSERNDNVGGVFINLEISKCWSLEISRRLFNILFDQEPQIEESSGAKYSGDFSSVLILFPIFFICLSIQRGRSYIFKVGSGEFRKPIRFQLLTRILQKYECASDVVDFRTWPDISLETSMMSTMDIDGSKNMLGLRKF